MSDAINYWPVLRAYPAECQPLAVEFLDSAGGFSGARLSGDSPCSQGLLCLRRWPAEHPSTDRLEFIQAVLWHVHQEGFHAIPLPLETATHQGYVRHAGHLWEITPWLAGTADYHRSPSLPRLRAAAMTTLAEISSRGRISFHLPQEPECVFVAAAWPSGARQLVCRTCARRLAAIAACRSRIRRSPILRTPVAQRIVELFPRAPAARVQQILDQATPIRRWPLIPCLRDIWEENVLFLGDEVSGLVDAGALRPENVAADVARLLGSLAEDDRSGAVKRGNLAAYELAFVRFSEAEATLVAAFDTSGVLLGGINWLSWIYEQQRVFDRPDAVQARLDYFCRRLAQAGLKVATFSMRNALLDWIGATATPAGPSRGHRWVRAKPPRTSCCVDLLEYLAGFRPSAYGSRPRPCKRLRAASPGEYMCCTVHAAEIDMRPRRTNIKYLFASPQRVAHHRK